MTKEKLYAILSVIPDNSHIEISFAFDDAFGSSYDGILTGINVSFEGKDDMKAVIMLTEKKADADEDELIEAEPGEYNVA